MPEDELVEGMIEKCLTHYEKGEYEEGLGCFKDVTDFKQDALRAWYLKGMCLYKLSKYGEAGQAFKQALVFDIKQAQAWHMHGLALYKQGDFSLAAESFLEAAELERTNADHTFMASVCYALEGKSEEAQNAGRIACLADPERAMELLQDFFETVYMPLSKKSTEEKLEAQKSLNDLREEMKKAAKSKGGKA